MIGLMLLISQEFWSHMALDDGTDLVLGQLLFCLRPGAA